MTLLLRNLSATRLLGAMALALVALALVASSAAAADTTPPVVTFWYPAEGSYKNNGTIDFYYTVNESNTRRCKKDSGSWVTSCPTMFVTSYSGQGAHSYTVEATDLAGNKTTKVVNFTLDTIAPVITWSIPANGSYVNTSTPDHIYSVNESTTRRCKKDSGSWVTTCPTMFATSYSGQGAHSYTVEATDLAGNVTTYTANFTIDTVAPTVTMYYPAEGATVDTNPVDFYYTVNESNTRRCKKDSGSWVTTCPTMFVTSFSGNGPHSYTVESTDLAGNVTTLVRNFTLAVP